MTDEPWRVPQLPAGATVAIFASGPSMSAAIAEHVRRSGVFAIAINTTYRLVPWAWMLYGADHEWWTHREHKEALQFDGWRVTTASGPRLAPKGLRWLLNTGVHGFDPHPGCIRTGGNSTYQALHIAIQAGASRVLLCGMDMHGGHWHGEHPAGLKVTQQEQYAVWCDRLKVLAPEAARRGVDVVNCTPGSALRCFKAGDLENELARSEQAAACAALSA